MANGPQTYAFDHHVLDRDCMRLVQLVHSSPVLYRRLLEEWDRGEKELDQKRAEGLETEHVFPGAFSLTSGLIATLRAEEAEASRIMLNLAVVVRNNLDANPLLDGEDEVCSICKTARKQFDGAPPSPFPQSPWDVYRLFDQKGVEDEPLGIRETCNKLIHAKGVQWTREGTDPPPDPWRQRLLKDFRVPPPLDGFLCLFGQLQDGRTPWVCLVKAETFALHVMGMY
jgi:hypothetical protein